MIKKYYFFTLKEAIDGLNAGNNYPYNAMSLKNICASISYSLTTYPVNVEGSHVVKLWDEIFSRFYDHAIIKKSVDLDSTEDPEINESDLKEWIGRLLSVLNRSFPVYDTLLTNYESAQNSLMADVKATTENKNYFNDTPQNPNTEQAYEGDNYITNFSKNVNSSSSELNTKMGRLKEIQDNYIMILNKWTKEFERLFYEGI